MAKLADRPNDVQRYVPPILANAASQKNEPPASCEPDGPASGSVDPPPQEASVAMDSSKFSATQRKFAAAVIIAICLAGMSGVIAWSVQQSVLPTLLTGVVLGLVGFVAVASGKTNATTGH